MSGADRGGGGREEQPSAKVQDAYALLERRIRMGYYRGGQRLKEADLAKELGISRTPVRDAIRLLERDGVVDFVPHKGAMVKSFTADEVEHSYAMRAIVEGFAASRAAVRMDDEAIAELARIHDEFVELAEDEERGEGKLAEANRRFHDAIIEGCQNRRVASVMPEGWEVSSAIKRSFWTSPSIVRDSVLYHSEILEAIKDRDAAWADAAMRTHIFAVKDFYAEYQRSVHIKRLLEGSEG